MQNTIFTSLAQLTKQRRLLVLMVGLVVVTIMAVVYVATTLEASEIKIITRYTAYGQTRFYPGPWTDLLSFAFFCVASTGFTIGLSLKMLKHDNLAMAYALGWTGIGLIIAAVTIFTHLNGLL